MSDKQKNVLGEDLEECSNDPVTGWFRDGCCNTDENDHGLHTVCAKVTTECLEWMKKKKKTSMGRVSTLSGMEQRPARPK